MNTFNDEDREIRELFRAARKEEESLAPSFEALREAAAPAKDLDAHREPRPRGAFFRPAALVTAAGTLVAAVVVVLAMTQPALLRGSGTTAAPPDSSEQTVVRRYFPPPPTAVPAPTPAEPEAGPILDSETIRALRSLGYVDSAPTNQFGGTSTGSDEFFADLPTLGREYQSVLTLAPGVQDEDGDGNPNIHSARDRDFKMAVDGVSNADPLAGMDPSSNLADAVEQVGNVESYAHVKENSFRSVIDHPLSTFSIDVDTASYANVRRFLRQGLEPPPDAVRIEEMINYFGYDYPEPEGEAPFSVSVEIAACPWQPDHRLARIGLRARRLERTNYTGSNLVFLIDVSGSMDAPEKLPLLESALGLLTDQLDGRDQIAIVVYAGSSGLVLDSTPGDAKGEIRAALSRLKAGGGTNGGAGLRLAYKIAREHFVEGGINRVILATDGDFNVGVTNKAELLELIRKDAEKGVFLTALGFGMGNLKDDTLELLADEGDGNYAYIDGLAEARKVLVEELGGTLVTVAKDVKLQLEFNPAEVHSYRLIGYENRMLTKEEFNDDKKDAGEIGAGHTVTALYEIVPAGKATRSSRGVDPLRYQTAADLSDAASSGESFTLKLRYKKPEGGPSQLLTFPIRDEGLALSAASPDFKFASAVALFGSFLRHPGESRYATTLELARRLALQGTVRDDHGYRAEFIDLIQRADALYASPDPGGD